MAGFGLCVLKLKVRVPVTLLPASITLFIVIDEIVIGIEEMLVILPLKSIEIEGTDEAVP
jgi:hypothetical protein